MLLAIVAILAGFVILVWSADRFVDGAAATAFHAGMPSLLIGMVIVGFGTSAPEMVVSAMAALDNSPELALGNALGSNIVNTSLILGVTALVAPIAVQSKIVRKEIPLLIALGLATGGFLLDGQLTRLESGLLLAGFFVLIGWSIFSGLRNKDDALAVETEEELEAIHMPLSKGLMWLVVGIVLMIASSRLLVWGAVDIAHALGVSDLVIGLTIVALGTSLPELAASVAAVRKGEDDIAIGNVVGSNMFNLLAVIGIAGTISPITNMLPEVMARDWPVMMGLLVLLLITAIGFKGQGRINRWEGCLLLGCYVAYNGWLLRDVMMQVH